MKYLDKRFSSPAANQAYRDNFDAVFGELPICPVCGRKVSKSAGCKEDPPKCGKRAY